MGALCYFLLFPFRKLGFHGVVGSVDFDFNPLLFVGFDFNLLADFKADVLWAVVWNDTRIPARIESHFDSISAVVCIEKALTEDPNPDKKAS